jgi:RNA polymerase sigma-70 factor (ECF subfamily)
VGVAESGEKKLIREEIRSSVQEALDALPYSLRAPLVFREYGELSYKEIGSLLGISENNVKVRVFRARERIGKALEEGDEHVS